MTKQHAYSRTYKLNPQVGLVAYAAGDTLTATAYELNHVLNEGSGGVIQSVVIADLDSQDADIELIFFWDEPSTTLTDNAALDLDDADLLLARGSITVASTDYKDYADNSLATLNNIGFCYTVPVAEKSTADKSLWVILVVRAAATWTNAANLQILITLWQD